MDNSLDSDSICARSSTLNEKVQSMYFTFLPPSRTLQHRGRNHLLPASLYTSYVRSLYCAKAMGVRTLISVCCRYFTSARMAAVSAEGQVQKHANGEQASHPPQQDVHLDLTSSPFLFPRVHSLGMPNVSNFK